MLSLEELLDEVRRIQVEREIKRQLEEAGIELPADDPTPPEAPPR